MPGLLMNLARRAIRLAAIAFATTCMASGARADGTLRVAMTLADIPQLTGQPDQGLEGYRFAGYTIYDSLINWDLSRGGIAPPLTPGLALSWRSDEADHRRWTFELRPNVKFHDGSAFDAAAVIWNLDKIFNDKSPQFDIRQASQVTGRITPLEGYRAVGPMTVEITTKSVDAFFPWEVTYLLFSSPEQWAKLGRNWDAVAKQPSGTGPFKFDRVVPRERLELVRNTDYWDKARVPKLDRLVLLPVPNAATRTSALLSGQVDWVETPATDSLDMIAAAHFNLVTSLYPQIWPYEPSRLTDSPWNDIRVRKAVNLAIDREGMAKLLHGTMQPASGYVYPGHPWYGTPSFKVGYDPAEARRLLAEAGYAPAKPLRLRIAISPSGSGQMEPMLMNQFIQQNLAEVGVDLQFDVVEWETLRTRRRVGAKADTNKSVSAINNAYGTMDPSIAFLRQFVSSAVAPRGFNWGNFKNEKVDMLIEEAQNTFDPAKQDTILARVHEIIVDEAAYVFVAHDLGPRALAPSVKGFVAPQSWLIDLTQVTIQK